jgi:hypothetical protein
VPQLPPVSFRAESADLILPIVRLSADVLSPHRSPDERQRRLLEGLRRLLSAERGLMVLATLDHRTGEQRLGQAVQTPATLPRIDPSDERVGPALESFVSLRGMQCVGRILLARPIGQPRFTAAERRLVDVLHHEFAWVYGQGAALPLR